MRIIYTGFFRFPCYDAAASRVLNKARILRALGHDVMFISFGGKERDEDKRANGYVFDGFPYIVTNEIGDNRRSLIKKVIGKYNQGTKSINKIKAFNADAIIGYNTSYAVAKKLLDYCMERHIPYIEDRTEWYSANETFGGRMMPLYWLSEWNMKHVQREFVKNKIVISTFLDEYYCHSNNIILPPLIDTLDAKWSHSCNCKDERVIRHKGRRLIFAGNPAKKDLLSNIIKGLSDANPIENRLQLIVVGVSDTQSNLFVDIEMKRKLGNSLVFLGRVPQDEVPSYYGISDCSLIIRENDRKNRAGFPTKMAESMAAGCPVMMNLTSDLADYAKDGKNAIIIKDFSTQSVTAGFLRLVNLQEEQLAKMKSSAKVVGQERFDWRNYMINMELFMDNLRK